MFWRDKSMFVAMKTLLVAAPANDMARAGKHLKRASAPSPAAASALPSLEKGCGLRTVSCDSVPHS